MVIKMIGPGLFLTEKYLDANKDVALCEHDHAQGRGQLQAEREEGEQEGCTQQRGSRGTQVLLVSMIILFDGVAINHVVRKIFDHCHTCDHREYLANDYLVYNHFKAKFEEKVNRFGLPR